jgi:FemAB-related protein (PEP-CTERM system-associated)
MSIEVGRLGTETLEWDAFVRTCDDGSPFHLTAWKRAVESAYGLRSHYLLARNGSSLVGVLPLFEVRGLLGGRGLVSVPFGVYGGICATSDAAGRALVEAARSLASARGCSYVELRQRRDLGLGLPTKARYVTFSRAISKDEEDNARAIPRKQRRMTRQGAKYGLRTTLGRQSLDRIYDIYAESVHRLGSPVFSRRLFHGIVEAFDKDCEVLAVWHNERIVAGVLTLFYEDQVLPYYGADLREKQLYGVADFMYWELMCHAARAGYRVFDFGRSREGTGSYDFKRHWGFEPVPLPYQYVLLNGARMPDLSPSNPRFRLATEFWKRLPLGVTKALGPLLTRFVP